MAKPRSSTLTPRNLTGEQLLERLCAKGFTARSRQQALLIVERQGYCHLVRYAPALKARVGNPDVIDLYNASVTDSRLQCAVLRHCIVFERMFKSMLSRLLSDKYGPYAHMERKAFRSDEAFSAFRRAMETDMRAHGKSEFAKSHSHGSAGMPIWAALYVSSFGKASRLYDAMTGPDRKEAAALFDLTPHILSSWLKATVFLRNECAHGGVLYGRHLEKRPVQTRETRGLDNRYAFCHIVVLSKLIGNMGEAHPAAMAHDLELIFERPPFHLPDAFGFTPDWKERLLSG